MDSRERVWRERGLRGAVLAGDKRAWRTLYDEAFAGLYAYVLWRCGGMRESADEVVQDVWLTAVRRIRSFDPEHGGFLGWLRGIAANQLRNHFRRRHRDCRTQPLADEHPTTTEAAPDRAERVARALATLPDRYEAVLRAKYLEGRSVADIAEADGGTVKAVESLLTRARQAFRDAYDADED